MASRYHPISLNQDRCIGCTNCIKRCPTQAIRVRNEKATIFRDRCINCGMCITICPYHAFRGVAKGFKGVSRFPYKVGLVDPILYGQFNPEITPEMILNAIRDCGCDDTFEVSKGADLISSFTKKYLAQPVEKPVISSSCPAMIRLIQLRFPELIRHILPIDSPVEVSAYMARMEAMKKTGFASDEIGIFYFTPCPARIASFIEPVGTPASSIDMAIPIRSVYVAVNRRLNNETAYSDTSFYPSGKGIQWARIGGQGKSLDIGEYLAVDGIEHAISLLEEIEYGKIRNIQFLECQACINGCVGGSLNVENSYIAKNRIQSLGKRYAGFAPEFFPVDAETFLLTEPIQPLHASKLDKDLTRALKKLEDVEKTLSDLPGIDCGACGAPSCRAFAEDIVQGFAKRSECVVLLKKRTNQSPAESE